MPGRKRTILADLSEANAATFNAYPLQRANWLSSTRSTLSSLGSPRRRQLRPSSMSLEQLRSFSRKPILCRSRSLRAHSFPCERDPGRHGQNSRVVRRVLQRRWSRYDEARSTDRPIKFRTARHVLMPPQVGKVVDIAQQLNSFSFDG